VEESAARPWTAGAAACVAALALGAAAGLPGGQAVDRAAYRTLNRSRGPLADILFTSVTEFGSIWASVSAAVVVATAGRRRREAVDALGAALAMWAVGQALKRVVARPRPYRALERFRLLIAEPRGTSWPSSHPAVLLAFGRVLGRDLTAPAGLRRGLSALAATVGASRVYLGVHYPADVVGGLLLGRGLADVWSATVSPVVLARRVPKTARPGTVGA
jgi:undecaprenyl-diphosphatase